MSSTFLPLLTDWTQPVQESFDELKKQIGHLHSVAFRFGPPESGHLPFQIYVDGRKTLRCNLSDVYPHFLADIRGWLERCLLVDRDSHAHPEVLTLDCADTVLWIILYQAGCEDEEGFPTSGFVAFREDRKQSSVSCFCPTREVISGIYDGLLGCLRRYRHLFDSPDCWYDVKRFNLMDPRTTTDRMIEDFRSERLDRMHFFRRKK